VKSFQAWQGLVRHLEAAVDHWPSNTVAAISPNKLYLLILSLAASAISDFKRNRIFAGR
jgi:hypothetical protein